MHAMQNDKYLLESIPHNGTVGTKCCQLLLIQLSLIRDHHHQVKTNIMIGLTEIIASTRRMFELSLFSIYYPQNARGFPPL